MPKDYKMMEDGQDPKVVWIQRALDKRYPFVDMSKLKGNSPRFLIGQIDLDIRISGEHPDQNIVMQTYNLQLKSQKPAYESTLNGWKNYKSSYPNINLRKIDLDDAENILDLVQTDTNEQQVNGAYQEALNKQPKDRKCTML